MPVEPKNLSDKRGNHLGIWFFRVMLSTLGPACACAFVWFVAFFYAVFDRYAFKAAKPYLLSRFSQASKLRLWWHFYRMIVAQGQAIVLAHWLRTGHQVPIREEYPERLRDRLLDPNRGLILLISHAGCWQAAMTYLQAYQRPVNLLIQANANANIAKMFSGQHFNIVNNDGPFGGLLECVAAIERGEIVCIMGDRQAGNNEKSVAMNFLNRSLLIPLSPWLLAARCHCPILPVFTMMQGLAHSIDFYFSEPIIIDYDLPQKPQPEIFALYIKKYAGALEKMARLYPYQIFHYDPISANNPPQER